ncbi:hypothetical protein B0H34DRAFT_819059 [Crassisporium funariophilum]|nr:hypothetical protein B0H34DRAFT_819059 [Crassisporium funariophilum]
MRRGRVEGRVMEMWAVLGAVGALSDRRSAAGQGGGDWAVVDEEGLAQIAQILGEQQAGLQHLTRILQKAQRDLNVILGLKGGEGEGMEMDQGETLWTSTGGMRSSMR